MKRRDFIKSTIVTVAGTSAGLASLGMIYRKRLGVMSPGEAYAAEPLKVYSVSEGKYVMSADEWLRLLTPEQFRILRKEGTERPFTGKYNKHDEEGIYQCAGCRLDLYSSRDKFDSGTGWPSFTRAVAGENVATRTDFSFFSKRTELLCARCDGHLGHVFDDGPPPTGKRHCINSVSLTFVAERKGETQ